jgi:hypothetical protein
VVIKANTVHHLREGKSMQDLTKGLPPELQAGRSERGWPF